MSMFDDDLATMYADPLFAGHTASIGASSTMGTLAQQDVLEPDLSGGFATTSRLVLTIRAGSLAGLARDVDLVLDGTTYRVRDIRHRAPNETDIILA